MASQNLCNKIHVHKLIQSKVIARNVYPKVHFGVFISTLETFITQEIIDIDTWTCEKVWLGSNIWLRDTETTFGLKYRHPDCKLKIF